MNPAPSTHRDFLQSAGFAAAGAALGARVHAADPVPADAAIQHPQLPRSTKPPLTARLVRHGGVLKIEINGTIFEPLAYRSYRPTPELIGGFAGTGLKLANVTHTGMLCTLDVPYSLFGEVWTGPEQFDWNAFDSQMALFESNAPGAYYNIALQLDTRDCYLNAAVRCGFTPGRKSESQRDQTFDMQSKGLLETTPLFEVRDESAQTFGVYDSDQTPAVAARTFAEYTSVYSAVGGWPAALYRELARAAGVHIYYEGNDPV